jgi:hypothetical protein
MCSEINYISFFQSLKVLTINVGTLPILAACSTQDKKLDSRIKYHFAWNQTQYPVAFQDDSTLWKSGLSWYDTLWWFE